MNRYYSDTPPPLIRLWLEKAPLIFLVIAALTFIIGLNLFAYLSSQVCMPLFIEKIEPDIQNQLRYVSLSTNAFTGAHILCLLIVTTWFIYRLKHTSMMGRWIRTVLIRPQKSLGKWLFSPYRKYMGNLRLRRNLYWYYYLI